MPSRAQRCVPKAVLGGAEIGLDQGAEMSGLSGLRLSVRLYGGLTPRFDDVLANGGAGPDFGRLLPRRFQRECRRQTLLPRYACNPVTNDPRFLASLHPQAETGASFVPRYAVGTERCVIHRL